MFEATIRVLGGLTSAHKLGGDTRDGGVLRKALDLAEKLLPAFKTASGIPIMDVNFATGDAHQPTWTNRASLAEVGTLVLEWAALEEALLVAENRSETTRTRQRWVMHGVCEASAAMAAARDAGEPPEADYEYGFDEEGLVKIYLDPASSSSIGESEDVSRCPASPATSTLPSLAGRAYARDIATPSQSRRPPGGQDSPRGPWPGPGSACRKHRIHAPEQRAQPRLALARPCFEVSPAPSRRASLRCGNTPVE